MALTKAQKKWAIASGIIGVPLISLVLMYLISSGAIAVTNYTGDQVCAGTESDPCIAEINFTVNKNSTIPALNSTDRIWLFNTDKSLKKLDVYINGNKYTGKSFPLKKGQNYTIRFVALKNDQMDTIKWGFGTIDPFWYGINKTANISTTSMIVELGTVLNLSGNITGAATVCVDIDHPDYNISYKCGTPTVNFLLNISYFRNDQLNDSSNAKNVTWSSRGNQTVWIRQHQYDEILNISIKLTAYNYTNVKIYVNNTLSNNVGEIFNGIVTLDELGGEYPVAGVVNEGLTGSSVGSCYAAYPCSNAWDHNWSNFSAASSVAVNISINYTIPKDVIMADAIPSLWGNSGLKNITTYCLNGGVAVFMSDLYLDVLDPTNYSFRVNKSCFDNEINLTVIYGITDLDRIYETKIQWYTGGNNYDFPAASTSTFTINISSGANVTSAYWNVTGILLDNILSEKQDSDITGASQLYTGNYYWSQSFKPVYKNLSKLAFPLSKLGTPSSGITVNIGTTVNGTEIATGTIAESDVPLAEIGWVEVDLNTNLTVGNTYYITLLGSYTGGTYFWYRSATDTNPYPNGNATTNIAGVNFDMGFRTYVSKYPEGIVMEIGTVDGVYEWNYSAEYSISSRTSNLSTQINNYLSNCTASNGYCTVPGYISTQTPGTILLSSIEINYTIKSNPIYLDVSLVRKFLNYSINFANVPIKIESDQATTIQVSDIRMDYRGGNDTIKVFMYQSGVRTNNMTLNITYHYSDFLKFLPYTWTEKVFFMPKTNSSKNVTAYGQTTTIPIFNITTTNYGMNLNISFRVNQTYSCLNISYNMTGSSKPLNQKINTTWQKIASNLEYNNNTKMWLWADLTNCNASDKRILNPQIYLESYCKSCIWEGS